ncbi:MAG: AAA family ATPase [Ardenticatenales bacterium]|nr:AAA family ATPase [Ardenticatenales bacterium]
MRDLLYGGDPSPRRLQRFVAYTQRHELPAKWTFPTYFLFLLHPQTEMFVKPDIARWFLRFMGAGDLYQSRPDGEVYAGILAQVHALQNSLADFGPRDMIDMQSFIWVCARESRARTSGLKSRDQIELDVPPTVYTIPAATGMVLREENEEEGGADEDEMMEMPAQNPPYSLAECAADTYLDEAQLALWVNGIERKKQAIFYGPPGTGKTFVARKLAQHLVGGSDGLVEMVQFHPAYAYEDFVQGIRPQTMGGEGVSYAWSDGAFLRFCAAAAGRRGRCVLIIDEINRADLARVFGELLYLLEYRDESVTLAGGQSFRIPANVRLLGTMNTADRSIAVVDYALRRRFAFIGLWPDYAVLRRYHAGTNFDPRGLITVLQQLNSQINDPHYAVGVSYFLRPDLASELADIWRMEIEPYLEEYFFNQADQVAAFRWSEVEAALLPAR